MPILRPCPVCDSGDGAPVGHMPSPTRPMHVVACRGCGLVFVNPMYTNAEKEVASPVVRALHRSRSSEHSLDAALSHSRRRMGRCLDTLRPYLRPGQDVLEVGSGDGAMLGMLQEHGVRPCGIDLDGETAVAATRRLGVPVLVGTFEETDFGSQRFDAVLLIHIIEHFFDPVAVLQKVRRVLKPGGLVFLETPNILRPKVGPRRVFSFAHNYHFSPRTLALALHQAGFRPTRVREFRRDSFQIVARALEPDEAAPLPRTEPWSAVARRVARYRFRYLATLQFLWRKLPWLKDTLMYRARRDLTGAQLQAWLTGQGNGPHLAGR